MAKEKEIPAGVACEGENCGKTDSIMYRNAKTEWKWLCKECYEKLLRNKNGSYKK